MATTHDIFAEHPVLQRVAKMATAQNVSVEPLYTKTGFIKKRLLLLNGHRCLVSRLSAFRYAEAGNPQTRKVVRAEVLPFADGCRSPISVLILDIHIQSPEIHFEGTFFISGKTYFETFPNGVSYIPIEPAKRIKKGAALNWNQFCNELGLRRTLTLMQN